MAPHVRPMAAGRDPTARACGGNCGRRPGRSGAAVRRSLSGRRVSPCDVAARRWPPCCLSAVLPMPQPRGSGNLWQGEGAKPLGAAATINRHNLARLYMDSSPLIGLGKVAGIGGIALGLVVLLLRPIIDRSGSANSGTAAADNRGRRVGIGLLGMVLWWIGTRPSTQRTRTQVPRCPSRRSWSCQRSPPARHRRSRLRCRPVGPV